MTMCKILFIDYFKCNFIALNDHTISTDNINIMDSIMTTSASNHV